jgi:hypothetical protein
VNAQPATLWRLETVCALILHGLSTFLIVVRESTWRQLRRGGRGRFACSFPPRHRCDIAAEATSAAKPRSGDCDSPSWNEFESAFPLGTNW